MDEGKLPSRLALLLGGTRECIHLGKKSIADIQPFRAVRSNFYALDLFFYRTILYL